MVEGGAKRTNKMDEEVINRFLHNRPEANSEEYRGVMLTVKRRIRQYKRRRNEEWGRRFVSSSMEDKKLYWRKVNKVRIRIVSKVVSEFEYLESMASSNGSMELELKQRPGEGAKVMAGLAYLWRMTNDVKIEML